MRKTLITLALIAAPVLAAAQQPVSRTQTPAAAHDSSKAKVKAKPKATRHAGPTKKATHTARDTTKVKPN